MHKPHDLPERADIARLLGESGFGDLVADVQRCLDPGAFAGDI